VQPAKVQPERKQWGLVFTVADGSLLHQPGDNRDGGLEISLPAKQLAVDGACRAPAALGRLRLSMLTFVGVRVGGPAWMPFPWRWGYGWDWLGDSR
jgi:hypothetical protein